MSYLEADNRSRVRRGVKSCKEQAVMTVLEVNRDHAKLERIHSQRLLDDAYDVNYADVDQTRIPEPPHSIPTRRKKANKTSEESESAPESSKLPARNKSRYRDESDSSDDDSFDWCLSCSASNLGSLKPQRTLSLPLLRCDDVNNLDVGQTRIPEPPHTLPTRRKKANKTSEESESAPESSKLPARNKSRYRDESDSSDDDSFDWCLSCTASNLGSLKPLRTLSLPSFRPLRYKLKCTGDDDSDESKPDSYTCAFQHSPKSQTESANEDPGFLELATASLKLPVHVQEDWEEYRSTPRSSIDLLRGRLARLNALSLLVGHLSSS